MAQTTGTLPAGRYDIAIDTGILSPFPAVLNFNNSLTEQGTSTNFPITATWFPIIPQGTLSIFLERVIHRGHLGILNGFLTQFGKTLRMYAGNGGVNCAVSPTNTEIVEAANLSLAAAQQWVTGGGWRTAVGIKPFNAYYKWLPGNYYIGPTNRSDLPTAGNIDVEAQHIIGNSHWNLLNNLNVQIQLYLRNESTVTLEEINKQLMSLSETLSVAPLRPNNWQFSNGFYRINTSNQTTTDVSLALLVPLSGFNVEACNLLTPTFEQMRRRY
ncbi:hypothetical protein V2A85_23965, partial [Yersinia sp. 1252 StPb PI]|uniref:hypothetical protein n=1 Tax=Yersinia sp. 1252 StPb PI TaxID=3117404 RepID=UPI003B288736